MRSSLLHIVSSLSSLSWFSSLLLAAACGGGQKPAESAADTSSLETSNAGSSKGPAAAPKSASSSESSSSKEASSDAASTPPTAAAAESVHPVPSVAGAIDGKSFSPKMAHVVAKAQKDGRVLLRIDERTECTSPSDVMPDDAVLTVLVPWEDGYKIDLSALKRATKKSPGEIGFARINAAGKKELSPTFKPSGRLQMVHTPSDKSATGKLKIDLQSGDYMLAGDLDIEVCVAPK